MTMLLVGTRKGVFTLTTTAGPTRGRSRAAPGTLGRTVFWSDELGHQ